MQENMFFSDEPGFYKDGEYGIRIESVLRVVNIAFNDETFGKFVGFESITLVPFEPKLIDFSMMSPGQGSEKSITYVLKLITVPGSSLVPSKELKKC